MTGTAIGTSRFSRAIVRGCLLALLMSFSGAMMSLSAQAPGAAAQPEKRDSAQQPGGPAHQLAHETREAAGEEKDEMAEFKQSASVQLISRLTGLNLQRSYWLSVVFNFVVIAGVLFWGGRKFLPGLFRDRTSAIQKAMQEAEKASEEARRKLAEIESRLMKLDVEIGMMRNAAEKEAA